MSVIFDLRLWLYIEFAFADKHSASYSPFHRRRDIDFTACQREHPGVAFQRQVLDRCKRSAKITVRFRSLPHLLVDRVLCRYAYRDFDRRDLKLQVDGSDRRISDLYTVISHVAKAAGRNNHGITACGES